MTTLPCPECGAPLELVPDGVIDDVVVNPRTLATERRARPAAFAACTACEFCLEITRAPTP